MPTLPNETVDGRGVPQTVNSPVGVQQVLLTSGQNVALDHTLSSSAAQTPPQQTSRHLIAGMMVVPSLSSTHISSGPQTHPLLIQSVGNDISEFQILRAQAQQQQRRSPIVLPASPRNLSGIPATTVASPSGGTIHHLGQNPLSRGGILSSSPLQTNPLQQQLSIMSGNMQSNQQQQLLQGVVSQLSRQQVTVSTGSAGAHLQQRRSSGSRVSGQNSPGSSADLVSSHINAPALKMNRTSPLQSPDRARKRIKLEEIPPATPEIASKRKLICDQKLREIALLKENYKEHLTELFFLQNGGQLMDYFTWKKRPTMQLIHFLKSGTLDSEDENEGQEKSINNEVKVLTAVGGNSPLTTPIAISTSLPDSVASAQLDQNKRQGGRHGMVFGHVQQSLTNNVPVMPGGIPLSTTAATTTVGSPPPYSSGTLTPGTSIVSTVTTASTPTATTTSVSLSSTLAKMMMEGLPSNISSEGGVTTVMSSRMMPRPHSISAVYEHTLGSQEAIVERAKQEAQVMQRVAELRKEGLWSSRRLPKVQEPPRNKAHWDYLLEEMQWLAADFAQERKWKKAGAKKIARMITRHFQELHQKEVKAEKEEGLKTKRIANNLSKMVKEFWSNIEKVVQYKQNKRLEEKQKKALDLHLSFIVDQTEKYSSWLTEGLSVAGTSSRTGSIGSSAGSGPDDGEFEPTRSESDDEETIDIEEADLDQQNTQEEIDALQKESELPLEDLLKSLPKEVLEKPARLNVDGEDPKEHKEAEYRSGEEESEDDEETVAEQEKKERKVDHTAELQELKDEGDMSMEELYKKYAGAYDSDFEAELSGQSDTESDSDEEDTESETEEEEVESEDDPEMGLDFLTQQAEETSGVTSEASKQSSGPNKELTDIAEAAESIQPTGYTLETTQVKTPIPFLLKHTLREYQHVGLDWLATLHQRKLNGILADEMGLGKTIQTIAVLANLATEWGVWGPHLIVVPTSVMLNWEMEFKKWCPAFKILTYYGNQKERKLKRQGWTKTNAFHVCITSYKLVIQDHQSFRRKKWKYLVLDEAQNIKNFKSQRWQTLLNFSSQRRLLLTGTPLQNSLMELWSLMHFLMPHVFQSHKEFKEWFANPLSNMIEGSREYNEGLIKRLHKVLRPFLLRRLKADVEKQMPQKYEHVVMCRLSKRQRFLYDDFMSQAKTKETLASGHFMSVINILMQLRKVCNHPNLFDPRPIQSPFQMEGLTYHTPSLIIAALQKDPLDAIDLSEWHPSLSKMETTLSAFAAHRIQKLQTPRRLIEEIDTAPDPAPRLQPVARCKPFVFRGYSPTPQASGRSSPFVPIQHRSTSPVSTKVLSVDTTTPSSTPSSAVSGREEMVATDGQHSPPPQGKVPPHPIQADAKAVSVTTSTTTVSQQVLTSHPITLQIHQTQQGTRFMIPSGSLSQLPAGYIQIVQTSSGQQFIATTSQPLQQTQAQTTVVNGPTLTSSTTANTSTVSSVVRPVSTVTLPTSSTATNSGKPVIRVSPMTSQNSSSTITTVSNLSSKPTVTPVVKPTPVIGTSLYTSSATHLATKRALQKEAEKSEFYLPSLSKKQVVDREEKLHRLASYNQQHCGYQPVYGQDLHSAVSVMGQLPSQNLNHRCPWKMLGYIHCCRVTKCSNPNHPSVYWNQTNTLKGMIRTPEQYLKDMKDIIDRYVFAIPPVMAPRIQMHASHPPPAWRQDQRHTEFVLTKELSPKAAALHVICSKRTVQFPELRLIEYDCGKLQTLDLLLHRLKAGTHRVLIFTQMTRMLDVLEQFLSYHGHRYLRLDGTTKVEQRQVLMDRFNMDKRIFCFILSTRSGGIGVNLTGADTVIFYDSDWNPTMDAQAQDRCHRIGQTRDVHIYRLISQKTVEENILKKANQKRLLGDVAIEGGNFTAAYFKEQTLKELFEEPSGLDSLAKEKTAKDKFVKKKLPSTSTEVMPAISTSTPVIRSRRSLEKRAPSPALGPTDNLTTDQLEQALGAAEEETDIQAARVVKAEQKAELAEFDEEIPWDEREAELKKERDDEISKVEQELTLLEKELTSIERYAVFYVENQNQSMNEGELQKAEEEVTLAKEEWELSRLQALKEEDERRAELEEDEMLFTYSHDDAYSQVFISEKTGEHMPMWAPPTPPQDDNDVYMDSSICFLYEPSVMPESQLPPVFVKKEHKRIRIDPAIAAVARKQKVRKEEHHRVPRSLFDRPQSLLRKERDLKLMKLKQFAKPLKPPLLQSRPLETAEGHPDWLIHEDWALLQALQMLQELPPTLSTDTPAIIPNWDLVADMVNICSRTYRSIKQCKNRYENFIVPREEGKILYDINPRKQKKSKGIYKTKNNRPMRTSQLFLQDNNTALTTLYSLRFDSCKAISAKRTPTIRPTLANPTLKNPKHAAVLAENGINYEQPLTPTQVAGNRAERIAKEKQKSQEAAAQQLAQRAATTQAATVTGTVAITQVTQTIAGTPTVQTAVGQPQMTIIPGQQIQTTVSGVPTTVVVTAGSLQKATGTTVAAVSLARTLGPTGSIVVNPANANTFAAINKRIAGQTVVGTVAQTLASTSTSSIAQAVRAARASGVTVQAAVVNQSPARLGAATAQVMTTSALTPAHIIAAQKAVTVSNISAGAVQQGTIGTTKTLTPQQLQLLRIKQQQFRRLTAVQAAAQQVSQTVTGVGQTIQKTGGVTTPLITSITQSQVTPARFQLAKQQGLKGTTVSRSLSEAEMTILIKRQQLQQQQRALSGATIVSQGAQGVQQVQVTQGHVTRLTAAQLITGTQVQQVQAGQLGTGTSQPIATLVKTVSTQGGAGVPSVTIPVTAVSLGISVNVPTQKTIAGKSITQTQMRQIQLAQQLQRKQLQVAAQQKVTTLGQLQQVGKLSGSTTPLIIPQQQQALPKVMVQQILKQPPTQGATIQQIIASVPQTTTTTVIATQLVTQAQTVTKMSVPSGSITTAIPQATRVSAPMTVTAVSGGSAQPVTIGTGSLVAGTPTVTLTPSHTTLVKNIQDVVISPQKTVTLQSATAQQVKTLQQATTVRQIQGTGGSLAQIQTSAPTIQVQQLSQPGQSVTVTTAPKIIQTQPQQTTVVQQLVQPAQTVAQIIQPSAGVQQAVQKVLQESQAQAQHRVAGTQASGTTTTLIQQTPTVATVVTATPIMPAVISSQSQLLAQQIVTTSGIQGQDGQGGKNSPYTMRLRNTRSDSSSR